MKYLLDTTTEQAQRDGWFLTQRWEDDAAFQYFTPPVVFDAALTVPSIAQLLLPGAPDPGLDPDLLATWGDNTSPWLPTVFDAIPTFQAMYDQVGLPGYTDPPDAIDLLTEWVSDPSGYVIPLGLLPVFDAALLAAMLAQQNLPAETGFENLDLPHVEWVDDPSAWFTAAAAVIARQAPTLWQLMLTGAQDAPAPLDVLTGTWVNDASLWKVPNIPLTASQREAALTQLRLLGAQDAPPALSLLTTWEQVAAPFKPLTIPATSAEFMPPATSQTGLPGVTDPARAFDVLGWYQDFAAAVFAHCPGWQSPIALPSTSWSNVDITTASWTDQSPSTATWTETDHPCP